MGHYAGVLKEEMRNFSFSLEKLSNNKHPVIHD